MLKTIVAYYKPFAPHPSRTDLLRAFPGNLLEREVVELYSEQDRSSERGRAGDKGKGLIRSSRSIFMKYRYLVRTQIYRAVGWVKFQTTRRLHPLLFQTWLMFTR